MSVETWKRRSPLALLTTLKALPVFLVVLDGRLDFRHEVFDHVLASSAQSKSDGDVRSKPVTSIHAIANMPLSFGQRCEGVAQGS